MSKFDVFCSFGKTIIKWLLGLNCTHQGSF